jgi:serpin B
MASGQLIKSKKRRNDSPAVAEADLAKLVVGNSVFAFNLYRTIRHVGTNLFFSPYSISEALALAYAGACGHTEKDMAEALDFNLSADCLHPAFNSLDLQFKERGQGAKGKDEGGFRLHVVNAIWGQKGYDFLPQFLDILAQNYGAGLMILDFINEAEQSRVAINEWVSEQTEDKIRDLVPKGAIDQLTRLVLTNAIYFNAAWERPFNKNLTSYGTFHLIEEIDITVPMMRQTKSFRYAEGDGYQAIELPYDGHELSMLILLPEVGQFNAFEELLDAGFIRAIIVNLEMHQVALTMPKFEYELSLGLKEALGTLGMGAAFTGDADFSGINGKRDLFLREVLHKAFVSVDEAGTEAAAATAMIIGMSLMPGLPIEMRIDRPFLFLIRDISTDSIIFLGRVLNPAK